jgi:hypothetical protein
MRYRVLDLPARGLGAFTPTMPTNPIASSWGLVKVTGAPGTEPQPATGPTRVWAPPISADKATQGSNVAPDMWLYDKYVAYANNMGPAADAGVGMAERRLTPLPVPAVNYVRVPGQALRTPKIAGRASMAWPRAFQRFPIYTRRFAIADA